MWYRVDAGIGNTSGKDRDDRGHFGVQDLGYGRDLLHQFLREREVMDFLGPVPSVWDETKVLDARIADYVLVARRNGREWYVGAMTDWTPRELEVDFSFLPEGTFSMEAFEDGVNADRQASDYKMVKSPVNKTTKLKIKLSPGGGWAARIAP